MYGAGGEGMKGILIITAYGLLCLFLGIGAGGLVAKKEIYKTCTTTGELWLHGEAFYCVPVIRE
jgi:hypothetical protein